MNGLELTGLPLSTVLGTLFGCGAVVVIFYLLKLRRRRVAVPFVRLWEQVLAEKQTTRLFSQLKRWLSLLVALAIVAALAFALGDPRYAGATSAGRTLVVLVDASASMQATDVEPTRFDGAKDAVKQMILGLGPADRMLIAQLDATGTPVGPMSGEQRVLLDALEELEVGDVRADLGAGLRLAADVLRGQPKPEVVLISDGGLCPRTPPEATSEATSEPAEPAGEEETPSAEPSEDESRSRVCSGALARLLEANTEVEDQDPIRATFRPIGIGKRNVGISAFSVRRYPLDKSQSEVLIELWNPTNEEQSVELTLVGDGEPVDVQQLNIRANERLRRFFRNVSGVDSTLEAKLTTEGDQLPADDHAYARLPERRRARVLVVTEGNLYLQAALLLDEYLDVEEVPPSMYPVEGHEYDVVIFDRVVPEATPDTSALYIFPQAEAGRGPFEITGEIEAPYFDRLDRRHPLLRWTALGDVNIARALEVRTQRGDRLVGRDGSGAGLMITGTREGQRFVAITFDVRESDLPLRVAWPLLLLNTVDWFVQESAGFVSSYSTGDTWHIPVPAAAERATIRSPDGTEREVPVSEGRAVFAGTRAGFHTVRTEIDGAVVSDTFAANVGVSDESDIVVPERLVLGDALEEPSTGEIGVRREIWIYLVLLVLGIILAEWWTYHRRISV